MNIRRLLPILALCLLTACQKDFDELNDTRQRWVEFSFDPSEYFSDILVTTKHGYALGASTELEEGYGLRIVGYCYEADSILTARTTIFGDMQHGLTMKFKHLDKDIQYHFLFIADIVKYDSEVDYYETWFQLVTSDLDDFYMMSFDRNELVAYNMLLYAEMDVGPANQAIAVEMSQITFNGYLVFTNLEDVSRVSATADYYQSFYIDNLMGKLIRTYDLGIKDGDGNTVVFPITASHADKSIKVDVTSHNGTFFSSYTITIRDPQHRPFVATVDCSTHQLTNLTLFEKP